MVKRGFELGLEEIKFSHFAIDGGDTIDREENIISKTTVLVKGSKKNHKNAFEGVHFGFQCGK